MRASLARFLGIARKELLHIRRDPQTLALTFLMPILMLLIYGYAIRLDLEHSPLVVRDCDRSPASRALTQALAANPAFAFRGFHDSAQRLQRDLVSGRAILGVTIPRGYARGGEPLQLLVDGSEPNSGTLALSYAEAIVREHPPRTGGVAGAFPAAGALAGAGAWSTDAPAESSPPATRAAAAPHWLTRIWYNPQLESTHFIVPGLVAILMMMVCALLTSITIAREKERGSFEALFVSPVRRGEIIFGKILPYIGVAFLVAVIVILFGTLVFGVPLRGSPVLLGLMALLYGFTALGIGVFISSLVRTQQAAMMGALMVSIMPSVMLSGFVFPIRSMPLLLQGVCWLIPARHFLVIIRGIILRGVGVPELWTSMLYLLVLGLLFLGGSTLRFRTRLT
ncbi:MAG: ABC transporter permease subunit [Candidatus Eisenbacteria bacterium]|nr:ABC transporter permease subunit [Candidatus Eisenbacteria bacterium]